MYNEFFGLSEKPFALEPNARFIVLTEDHREALATLVYAVEQQEGWAALVGPPGVGKTTLIIALLQELSDRVIPAVITNPRLEPLDFMNMIALELGLKGPFSSKGHFLVAFKQLVQQCRAAGKLLLLVVDEAQAMSFEMLEEMRLLSNIDEGSPKILNFLLAGQMEFLSVLGRDEAAAIRQRLRHFYTLRPLGVEETRTYIRHRLRVAQASPDIFTDRAALLIHQLTNGIPRVINTVCDEALIVAFTRGRSKVDLDEIKEAARDLPMLRLAKKQTQQPAAPPQPQPAQPQPAPAPAPVQTATEPPPKQVPPAASEPASAQTGVSRATPPVEPKPVAPAQGPEPVAYRAAEEAQPEPAKAAAQQPETKQPETKPAAQIPVRPASTPRRGKKKIKSKSKGKERLQPSKDQGLKKPSIFSRFFGSMGKGVSGGLARRLILLLILLALAAGGYWLFKSGNAVRLGHFIAPYIGLGDSVELFMPSEKMPAARKVQQATVPEDWGPTIVIAPKEASHG